MIALVFALLINEPAPQVLLICSCGEVAAFGAFEEKGAFLTPANQLPPEVKKNLRRWCHEKAKIHVWHTEKLTGKSCPISL